ncbi:sulfurtransferase [Lutimonas sp.]|uniref:sulfurtransferase n=1 Tax=Lutimonas sp. TaxID=1872403 RepID=UPI003D9B521B
MKASDIDIPLVSVEWLADNIRKQQLIVLNATLPKATAANNQGGVSEDRIPGARFFDIKNTFSISDAPFPNTRVDEPTFNKSAQALGINQDSWIIVYDDHGIYSSARAWWMFKAMGHIKVAVLDGGLPAWKRSGLSTEKKTIETYPTGNFNGQYQVSYFKDSEDVLKDLDNDNELVLDARAEDRFAGLVEEPRKGLRSGHIPHSSNIPYTDLLNNGKMKSVSELRILMEKALLKDKNITFSCGSGITACVLALGATLVGKSELSVYDGSWTEWGSVMSLPIEKE